MPEGGRALTWTAVGLLTGFSLLYIAIPSRHFSPDGLSFARLITAGDLSQPLFFQAEHLLFPLVGWLWFRLWQFLGYQQGALAPLQTLNALFGALGVALFFLLLARLMSDGGRASWLALPPALALGASYAYWFHSTEAEDQIISNTFLLASLTALRWGHRTRGQELGYGLVACASFSFALAILLHATQVLFLPAALLSLEPWNRRWKPLVLFAALTGLLVALPTLLIGWTALGLRAPSDYLAWALSAPSHGVWGQPGLANLWQGVKTAAASFAYLGPGPNFRALLAGEWASLGAILIFVVVVGGLALALGRALQARPCGATAVALGLAWLLPYGAFALYWAPEDPQFWIATLAPLLFLSAQAWTTLPRPAMVAGAFLPLLLLSYNLTAMLPRSDLSNNMDYAKASCLAEATDPKDLVVTPGWDWASGYLPYFHQRQVFSLIDNYLLASGRDQATLLAILRERVDATRAQGGRVLALGLGGAGDGTWTFRATGLTPSDLPLEVRPTGECLGETWWEVLP